MTEQAETGGTDAGELHRLALTEEDHAAHKWFRDLLEETGLDVRVDAIGNISLDGRRLIPTRHPSCSFTPRFPALRRALRRAARRS